MAKELNLYDLVPARTCDHRERDDGTVDVVMPRYGGGALGRFLGGFVRNRSVHVHLDDIGTGVWRLCDGRHTVHEIGESLHRQFGERIDPVYDRLELFLRQMKKSGMIEFRP
jgi:hypothetical protein